MRFSFQSGFSRSVVMLTAMMALACSDDTTSEPNTGLPQFAAQSSDNAVFATLRRVTAKYHSLDAALADGFTLLHPCEERGDEEPVGIVYVHFARLLDGVIDPELPDALIYEPSKRGAPKLVGVEFAIPYPLWSDANPPQFMGAAFQPEDEFGVFALHAWVWRHNPEGMFAETNPNVSCEAE